MWFFWCFLRLWATANYCRAGIKSLRGTAHIFRTSTVHLCGFAKEEFSAQDDADLHINHKKFANKQTANPLLPSCQTLSS
jgi:hypothetical protein